MCVAIILIRFGYVVNSDYLIVNICIHTRTLEGDGEKPSRHENEGPLFIRPFYFHSMMEVSNFKSPNS